MEERCGALDPSSADTLYYCTLLSGHDAGQPAITHRSEYRESDPDLGWPFTRAAFHEWTEQTGA